MKVLDQIRWRPQIIFGGRQLWKLNKVVPCAGYLGRLFSKLEAYTSITSLACHIAITKKGTCQEKK